MELAYGFVAQTLQTHDELVAGRLNEHRQGGGRPPRRRGGAG